MLRRFEGEAHALTLALARRHASSRSLGSLLRKAALPNVQPILRGNAASRLGSVRTYAQGPGGGMPGGFPGFSMGQQRQKGDALKEFVSTPLILSFLILA